MATIKISSKVEAEVWQELRALSAETGQSISSALTEAVREYVMRRRVRPAVMAEVERSLQRNHALGRLLAE